MKENFESKRIEKLLRNEGAVRVDPSAIEVMNQLLTDYGYKIAQHAVEIAKHHGRKTVKHADILMGIERMSPEFGAQYKSDSTIKSEIETKIATPLLPNQVNIYN